MDDLPGEVPRPPYYETLGIEITEIDSGHATGRMALDREISGTPTQAVAHGGAIASLADSVGYWAVSSVNGFSITPTVDLRVDYLSPATDDLFAEGRVCRNGDKVAVAEVTVSTTTTDIATVRGTFKTSGQTGKSPWTIADSD